MKKAYIISYDLSEHDSLQSGILSVIESFDLHAKINDSTWIIQSSASSGYIYDGLKPFLDKNDILFIAEIGPNHAGSIDRLK